MPKGPREPKPSPAWDRLPWAANGDSPIDTIYKLVGECLSEWEQLESELAKLFSCLVSNFESLAAERAYCAVRTFEARAEMLKAASEAYFAEHPNEGFQKSFVTILKHAKNFAPRRNEIAHGIVKRYYPDDLAPKFYPIVSLLLAFGLPCWAV
jgi:hypothetical protein